MTGVGSAAAFPFVAPLLVAPLLAPEPPGTKALGISGAGGGGSTIVGEFTDSTGTHGFLNTGGSFVTLDIPGASGTEAFGVNSAGDVVGVFANSAGTHGFVDTGGTYMMLDAPSASYTAAFGINGAGQIVGSYTANTRTHGFVYSGGRVPGDLSRIALMPRTCVPPVAFGASNVVKPLMPVATYRTHRACRPS